MSQPGGGLHGAESSLNGSEGEEAHDQEGPEKKRRRVAPQGRRPLSCTECKRRKTRCSSGVVPCEACIKRGKPDDCRWETGAGEVRAEHTFALSSELEALRTQVQELAGYVYQHGPNGNSRLPPPPPHTATAPRQLAHAQPAPTSSLRKPSSQTTIRDNVESAVTNLEHLTETGARSVSRSSASLPSPYTALNQSHQNLFRPALTLPALLDRDHRSSTLIDLIYSLIPEEVAGRRLASLFLMGPYHTAWHVLHGPSFGTELKEFYRLDPVTRRGETDPAWLAVYLMVLVFGLQDATPTEASALFPHLAPLEISRLPSALYQASRFALDVAKWDSVPQIRHIQTALLSFPFLYHFGIGTEEANQSFHHLASAISAAQWLGLDRLGSDPSGTPMHDLAFCDYPLPLAFELSKRLYHHLSFLDGTTSRRPGLWRLPQTAGTTALPGNLTDEDLMLDPIPPSRPASELTAATTSRVGSLFATSIRTSLEKSGAVSGIRRFSDETQDDDLSAEDIRHYDAALRSVLDSMPSPMLPTNRVDPQGYQISPAVNWMHCSLWTSIHNRILRIHRPGLARDFSTEEYERSRRASIASAKEIVATQRVMMTAPHLRPGFIKRWILGAALVLTVDLVISIDAGHDRSVLSGKRLDIAQALEIFEQDNPLDRSPAITQQCARTIDALLLACHHRLNARQSGFRPAEGEGLQSFFEGVASAISSPADVTASTLLWMAVDSNGHPARTNATSTAGPAPPHPHPESYDPAPMPDFSGFDFSFEGLMMAQDAAPESMPASTFDFAMFGGWESFGNAQFGGAPPHNGDRRG